MTTLKKDLISQFAAMTSLDSMKGSHLMLLTSAGIVIGTVVSSDETDPAILPMAKTTYKLVEGYYEENRLPANTPLQGNDGFFLLKNAVIQSSNTTTKIPFMVVFYDQVIAVSVIGDSQESGE